MVAMARLAPDQALLGLTDGLSDAGVQMAAILLHAIFKRYESLRAASLMGAAGALKPWLRAQLRFTRQRYSLLRLVLDNFLWFSRGVPRVGAIRPAKRVRR